MNYKDDPKYQKHLKKPLILTVTRPVAPLLTYCFLDGFVKSRFEDMYFIDFFVRCIRARGQWFYGTEGDYLGELLLEEERKQPGFLGKVFVNIYSIGDDFIATCREIKNSDLSGKPLSALLTLFKKYHEKCNYFALSLMGMYIHVPIEKRLKEILSGKPADYLAILTSPIKKNFPSKEQEALFTIAIELKKQDCTAFNEASTDLQQIIQEHTNTYGWVNTRGGLGNPWSPEEIVERACKIADPETELKTFKNHTKEEQKKSSVILEELKADENVRRLVQIAKEVVYFRTYRTDELYRSFYLIRNLLEALAASMNIPYEELINYSFQEIMEQNILSAEDIKARKADYAVGTVIKGEKIVTETAEETKKILDQHCETAMSNAQELKGQIANKGKVTGTVKILFSRDDLVKVEDGDILITPMTTPDFIPAMRKAAAFVTDEGGITCHAAIISREMNKPCVIGTKFATKVFKDGDQIIVDAENGIVKKK